MNMYERLPRLHEFSYYEREPSAEAYEEWF